MHIVVIHQWQEVTAELAQKLAAVLGVTAYDARQRLVGKGPVVIASFADPAHAQSVLTELRQGGFQGYAVNTATLSTEKPNFVVQRFVLEEAALRVADAGGRHGAIPFNKIRLLLPALRSFRGAESWTETERKFSMGKTVMAGGLPLKKERQLKQTVSVEEREKVLYLCIGRRTRVICPQNSMSYNGLGQKMQPSRELNFNYLVSVLRQHCPSAAYDDRLLTRAEQVRLLGPLLNPDSHLDLAVEILATGFDATQN